MYDKNMIDIYCKPDLLKQLMDWISKYLIDQEKSYDGSSTAAAMYSQELSASNEKRYILENV